MSYNPFGFDTLNPFKKENFYNQLSPHFGKPLTLLFGESDDEEDSIIIIRKTKNMTKKN